MDALLRRQNVERVRRVEKSCARLSGNPRALASFHNHRHQYSNILSTVSTALCGVNYVRFIQGW